MIQFSKILIFIKGKLIDKIKIYNLKLQILEKIKKKNKNLLVKFK
jgi:hypothetical protein